MDAWNSLEKPESLEEGQWYYLRQGRGDTFSAEMTRVKFIAHSSSPEVVVVEDGDKKRFRCGREGLYEVVDVQGMEKDEAGGRRG